MNATVTELAGEGSASQVVARHLSFRSRLTWVTLSVDIVLGVLSYEVAIVVFSWLHQYDVRVLADAFYWGIPCGLAVIVVTFLALGLYKSEAYVCRPLHLVTLFKALLIALVVTAFFAFVFKAPLVTHSRLTIFSAFAVFGLMDALVRVGLVDSLYRSDVRLRRGGTVVIGASADRARATSSIRSAAKTARR